MIIYGLDFAQCSFLEYLLFCVSTLGGNCKARRLKSEELFTSHPWCKNDRTLRCLVILDSSLASHQNDPKPSKPPLKLKNGRIDERCIVGFVMFLDIFFTSGSYFFLRSIVYRRDFKLSFGFELVGWRSRDCFAPMYIYSESPYLNIRSNSLFFMPI